MSGTLVDNIEWYRVADSMPDDHVDCIVSDRCGEIYLAYLCAGAWYIHHPSIINEEWLMDHFIWWAYAPAPPQEQKQI